MASLRGSSPGQSRRCSSQPLCGGASPNRSVQLHTSAEREAEAQMMLRWSVCGGQAAAAPSHSAATFAGWTLLFPAEVELVTAAAADSVRDQQETNGLTVAFLLLSRASAQT
ncbi:uncharacterized protein V6R79_019094 [Siganus canaliculatus]